MMANGYVFQKIFQSIQANRCASLPPIGKKSKQPAFTTKAENNRLKLKPAGAASAEFAQRLLYLFKLSSVYCLFRFFFTKAVYCSGEFFRRFKFSTVLRSGRHHARCFVCRSSCIPASIPKFCPQKSASCILGIFRSELFLSFFISFFHRIHLFFFCLLPNKHCFSEKTLSLHNFFRIQRFDSARFRPSVCIVCVKY